MKKDRTYRKSNLPENSKLVCEGILFDTYQWEQELYDGSKKIFERTVGQDIAKIIPVTCDGKIVIVEDEQPAREMLVKIPGGYVDEGEEPLTTATRELMEECGYSCASVAPYFDVAPWNKVDYRRYYFIAHGCAKVRESDPGAGEKIKVLEVSFDEFIDRLARGQMSDDSMQIRALQALAFHDHMQELRKLLSPR